MAAHWLTNRGKYLLATGQVVGATDIFIGYIAGTSVPTTMDTEAEIQDLNTLDQLLNLAGVDEPAVGGYARANLSAPTATEDDTNNRVNVDADNETMTGVASGSNIIAGFIYKDGGGADSTHELISVFTLDTAVPTNGSDITATITDLYRLT